MRGQGKTLAALLCAAVAIFVFCASAADAAPKTKRKPTAGKVDLGFGAGGRVLAPYTGAPVNYGAWLETAPSPGGATVVADKNRMFRFLPNGGLDPAFGTGGAVQIADPPGFEFEPTSLDVDSRGRVVLFGTAVDADPASAVYFEGYAPSVERPRFAMIQRYAPTGALDPGFNGDGVIQTDFGLPKLKSMTMASVTIGAVDAADRPVLVAGRGDYVSPCEGHSHVGEIDTLVSRINTDGQFDPTFGGGTSIVPLGPGIVETVDLDFGPDDGPIVLGLRPPKYPCHNPQAAILRMDVAGSPYSSYGQYGLRYIPIADPHEPEAFYKDLGLKSLALDPQGRVLVLAGAQVQRLDSRGRPDRKFGKSGAATVDLPGRRSRLSSFGVDPKGRILLAGTATIPAADKVVRAAFAALRLLPSGKADSAFGRRGMTITRFGLPSEANALSSYVDENGRLTIAGLIGGPGFGPTGSIGLARYLGG